MSRHKQGMPRSWRRHVNDEASDFADRVVDKMLADAYQNPDGSMSLPLSLEHVIDAMEEMGIDPTTGEPVMRAD